MRLNSGTFFTLVNPSVHKEIKFFFIHIEIEFFLIHIEIEFFLIHTEIEFFLMHTEIEFFLMQTEIEFRNLFTLANLLPSGINRDSLVTGRKMVVL